MLAIFSKRKLYQLLNQVPLSVILIVPFILQIFATVGLTGYLSWRNGQKAVNDVASQLRNEVTSQVHQHLEAYLTQPYLITQLLAQAGQRGDLTFKNLEKSEYILWQMSQVFHSTDSIYIGNKDGKFISIKRNDSKTAISQIVEDVPKRVGYRLDQFGKRRDSFPVDEYDPRTRPWYKKTEALEQPNWSPVYNFVRGELGITASQPLYNQEGLFQGVIGVDALLSLISDYISKIDISPNGQVFILERSGLMIATSTHENPFIINTSNKKANRIKGIDSQNLLTRESTNLLIKKFQNLNSIKSPQQIDFKIEGKRQFVQVVPYNKLGLDWLIVVVVPEDDFMGQIHANMYTTIKLCLVTFLVAIFITILLARWVTKPIIRLKQAAQEITQGNWQQKVELTGCQEVGQLAKSFNRMAEQLQESFTTLEAKNIAMEDLNKQLRQSEYRLNQFLDSLPVGVLVYDVQGRISYINRMGQVLLGKGIAEDISLKQFSEYYQLYITDTDKLYPAKGLPLLRALKGKSVKIENLEIRHPNRKILCEVIGTPIFDCDDNIVYAIVAFQDITHRKQAEIERRNFTEELKQKNEALERLDKLKDEFLANTSHELRTPLNGMIGLAESMLEGATGALSELQRKNLVMIAHSGHRLATLVNDILDFSKLRHNNIELQLKPVGLREITEIVLTLSKPLIGNKALQLINEIPPALPPVLADENRLQQILYNLVGNGIKFTEHGQVTVSAQVMTQEQFMNQLAITVSDTGIGIPKDKLERIFESFEQADGSTAREYGGTGLGLAVTKQLVELHKGQIKVDSTVGVGSCFIFSLPIAKDQPTVPVEKLSVFVNPSSVFSLNSFLEQEKQDKHEDKSLLNEAKSIIYNQFKILIVDDDPVNLQVLMNYLYLQQYAVTQAMNGLEAIAILEAGYIPDLILLDVMMPRMTGYEVTQKIRETWPAHQLPIMMLTAKNQVSDLVAGFEVGANDFLSKPLNKQELLARIKTHIGIKQLRTEKAHLRQTFGRYVTDEVVTNILDSEEGLKLGGERRKITILTSDLRGFTATSERLPPEEVVKILNFYLSEMADVITSYQGTIDEFMGDGILVLFGAPNQREDDAERAIACAVAMQLALNSINQQIEAWGYPALEMGIGINTGEVVVGNIGSEKRTKYGVVGNQVNLTYRIESYTTGGQIFISESTLNETEKLLKIVGEKQVQPKGVKQPITIYEVGGLAGKYDLFLTQEAEIFYPLSEPIPLQYTVLEGKHIGENLFSGYLVELSAKEAKIKSNQGTETCVPLTLTNVKLNLKLDTSTNTMNEDVYAKVLEKPTETGSFYIHFTSKPPEIEAKLNTLYKNLAQS